MQESMLPNKVSTSDTIEGPDFWRQWVTKQIQSNLNRKAFCRQYDLNDDRFQYWFARLGFKKQPKNTLIPVKAVTTRANESTPLCTVELSSGHRLFFHEASSLEKFLKRLR